MKSYKAVIIGASLLATLALAGCAGLGNDEALEKASTEQAQEVKPLYIAKPTIMDVEDDKIDTKELQKNLDEINDGERLDGYEPINEEERVLDFQDDAKFNDSVYTAIDPADLNEGTHVVYVGRDTCPYCQMLRVNLDPVVEQLELGLEYVDTDNKEYEAYMQDNFELTTVPQIFVFHDGEVVASFPQENMYLESGVDYQSLANGLGDLTNIYLSYKHDVPVEGIADDVTDEAVSESGTTESTESTDDATRSESGEVRSLDEDGVGSANETSAE